MRRDAYAACLTVLLDYQDGIEDILNRWETGAVDLQAEEDRLTDLRRAVRRAISVVSLEGPEELIGSLQQVVVYYSLLSTFVLSETSEVLALPAAAERQERARRLRRSDVSKNARSAITAFEAAARDVLDG
ncbi:hypothetical protein [Streptomyces sp. NPDC001389]|uniref:hypothetical protein n=1 Tax=Streptomyces sp. NPDC001389 TaxID=3364569 RepID=UPI0036911787